jgi:hypothetical protein
MIKRSLLYCLILLKFVKELFVIPTLIPSQYPTLIPSSQPTSYPSGQPSSQPTFQTRTFTASGSMQSFILPINVELIGVDIRGAASGTCSSGHPNTPGYGARVQVKIPVIGGSTLYIFLGTRSGNQPGGGWNGGGKWLQINNRGAWWGWSL